MAASASALAYTFCFRKPHFKILPFNRCSFNNNSRQPIYLSSPYLTLRVSHHFRLLQASAPSSVSETIGSSNLLDETESLQLFEERPVRFALWVLFWASLSLAWFAVSKDANAAVDSIKASGFGLKIARSLWKLSWPDEVVVFTLAALPVLELRGAFPVGYWMQLKPVVLTVLSILGNMVPVSFIILYLKRVASFLAARSPSAARVLRMLFQNAKEKAGPVEEFQ